MADDPIEDLFRHRLQHHEEAPPANGWQRIHHTLQQPEKKPFAFWRWLSLALLPVATTVLVVKTLPESPFGATPQPATNTSGTAAATPAASNASASGEAAGNGTAQVIAGSTHTSQNTEAKGPAPGTGNSIPATTAEANAGLPASAPAAKPGAALHAKRAATKPELASSTTQLAGNQAATGSSAPITGKFTAANRPENALAQAGTPAKKRKAKTNRLSVTEAAVAQGTKQAPLAMARQNQAALASANTTPTEKEEREETGEAAAPASKAAPANAAKTGNALPKNPAGSAPASGASAGAAAHATVPKAIPAGSGTGSTGNAGSPGNPNPPTVADSLIETDAKNAERLLAGNILVDPVLAATNVHRKPAATTQTEQNRETNPNQTGNRSWHFGATLGTRYGLRRFAPSTTDEVHIQQLSDKNKTYPARLDYEAGAVAQRQLSDKLALEAGLGVLYFREQVEFKAATAPTAAPSLTQTDNQIEYLPNYRYQTVKNSTTAWYATTRFGAVYNALGSGQTCLQLTGGGTASYLVTEKTTSNAAELGLAQPEPAKLQAGAYAGLRLLQKFPSGASVALEPGFTYYATPWQKQAAPYSLRSHAATVNLTFFLK